MLYSYCSAADETEDRHSILLTKNGNTNCECGEWVVRRLEFLFSSLPLLSVSIFYSWVRIQLRHSLLFFKNYISLHHTTCELNNLLIRLLCTMSVCSFKLEFLLWNSSSRLVPKNQNNEFLLSNSSSFKKQGKKMKLKNFSFSIQS